MIIIIIIIILMRLIRRNIIIIIIIISILIILIIIILIIIIIPIRKNKNKKEIKITKTILQQIIIKSMFRSPSGRTVDRKCLEHGLWTDRGKRCVFCLIFKKKYVFFNHAMFVMFRYVIFRYYFYRLVNNGARSCQFLELKKEKIKVYYAANIRECAWCCPWNKSNRKDNTTY